jgi:hypothetical protein
MSPLTEFGAVTFATRAEPSGRKSEVAATADVKKPMAASARTERRREVFIGWEES